jgi:hypothetical protein
MRTMSILSTCWPNWATTSTRPGDALGFCSRQADMRTRNMGQKDSTSRSGDD